MQIVTATMVYFEMNDRKRTPRYGKYALCFRGLLDYRTEVDHAILHETTKGTTSFGVGFFFVVVGWPIIGVILESYGFVVLFSGFWPTLAVFLQKIPILGWVFQQPFIRSLLDRYRGRRVPV
ncbi:hypothetical protein MLD38_023861 [Melastoma candidum]|uniref:Uncharacterized protein n=1 Tax=Melastoma candidum TaxID=119954 RepID=A0ACB9NRU3_9MYRT|nr:hypothetical protein MLD38_023861 [Melastoma candidum]